MMDGSSSVDVVGLASLSYGGLFRGDRGEQGLSESSILIWGFCRGTRPTPVGRIFCGRGRMGGGGGRGLPLLVKILVGL